MLGSREQHALLHQAGGVADAGHVAATGFDPKVVKVGAAEDNSGICRSGYQLEVTKNTSVKADAFGAYRVLNRGLNHRVKKWISTYCAKPISQSCCLCSIFYGNENHATRRWPG